MDINLYGPGEHPELSDDDVIKEFVNRLWDDPSFENKVEKLLLPYRPVGNVWMRHSIRLIPFHKQSGVDRRIADDICNAQGYILMNQVK